MRIRNIFYIAGLVVIIYGIILGVLHSLGILSGLYYVGYSNNYNFIQCMKIALSWIFIFAGLIISFFVSFFVIKDIRMKNRKNQKYIIWLSIIGLFTSIFLGAILELLGGIICYMSIKKPKSH